MITRWQCLIYSSNYPTGTEWTVAIGMQWCCWLWVCEGAHFFLIWIKWQSLSITRIVLQQSCWKDHFFVCLYCVKCSVQMKVQMCFWYKSNSKLNELCSKDTHTDQNFIHLRFFLLGWRKEIIWCYVESLLSEGVGRVYTNGFNKLNIIILMREDLFAWFLVLFYITVILMYPMNWQVNICSLSYFFFSNMMISSYCFLNVILLMCINSTEAFSWEKVEPKGKGPCPRRRQCCCMVGDRIILFGGTRWDTSIVTWIFICFANGLCAL